MLRALTKGVFRGLFLLALIGLGWLVYRAVRPSPPDEAALAEALPVTAEQLVSDYTADTVAADKRYQGRRLTVEGTVQALESGPALRLGGAPTATIWAQLESSERERAERLERGEAVVVHCVGAGVAHRTPQLHDCVIQR